MFIWVNWWMNESLEAENQTIWLQHIYGGVLEFDRVLLVNKMKNVLQIDGLSFLIEFLS